MTLFKGDYVSDYSDLLIRIVAIYHQTPVYVKAKYMIFNKRNGIFYEKKSGKLFKDRINHWTRVRFKKEYDHA